MSRRTYNVAIAGATGMVGAEFLKILEERDFPVGELRLLASERTAGSTLTYKGAKVTVGLLEEESFEGMDIGLFSAGASVSKVYAPKAAEAGCIVVDNTSEFRMDPDVPLVVPEVNPEAIAGYEAKGIIANPNCSTIQMVVALKPIYDRFGIKRVVVSTYQSVSGAGKEAMDELTEQIRSLFNMSTPDKNIFPHVMAFNCIPQIDIFLKDGYTKEEIKMVDETRKIFDNPAMLISPTAVRVPVYIGHSESVNVETEDGVTPEEVRELLRESPGIEVIDDPSKALYPMTVDCAERDAVFVGRIRKDPTVENGINMWVVSDNLRKGAALNTIQIAEILVRDYL